MQILDEGCLRQKEYCFFNIYMSDDPADFIQKHTLIWKLSYSDSKNHLDIRNKTKCANHISKPSNTV